MDSRRSSYESHPKEYREILNAILKIEEEDPTHYQKIKDIYNDVIGDCACDLDAISVESHLVANYIWCSDYYEISEECRKKLDKIKTRMGIR